MTALELRFPAGRFHATPWGRHVNEGAIEWPPSPWRILRTLIATWHLKAKDEVSEVVLRSLVTALATPPRIYVPPASTSHTRHYMPIVAGKNEKTTKIFDTFIKLPPDSVVLIAWDVDLPETERTALHTLAERIGYFGRAESLVIARLLEDLTDLRTSISLTHRESTPLASDTSAPQGHEIIRLLAPMAATAYEAWRTDFCAKALAALGPKPTASQKRKLPTVPPDLFAALHADTGDLQSAGWNLPPGSEFVNYTRPENAFVAAVKPRPRHIGINPTVARFAITSSVTPSIIHTISVADRVHAALCKWSDKEGVRSPVFTGLTPDGKPLDGLHEHSHILCETNGTRELITHITVWAKMGFDEAACYALKNMRKVWGHGGHDIHLVLESLGQPQDFAGSPFFATARRWRSFTPFVSTRHVKAFRDGRPKIDDANGWQRGSPPHDLLRLLAEHPQGKDATVRLLEETSRPYEFGGRRFRSLQFLTRRTRNGGARGGDSGAALEITFPEPRTGPFALGYAAHYGLGLFIPHIPTS